ncbi:MAG TPA: hypothetical protein VD906_14655 [Caulobacteraceae bacterium]|nr:hypothetical protein [Caulobacteraceae bacterium]
MNDSARGERLQIMLTQDELEILDNWRFSRRMPSRAAAVRELLKRGLSAEGFASSDGRTRSSAFGVIGSAENQHAEADGELDGASIDGLDGHDGKGRGGDGMDGHG